MLHKNLPAIMVGKLFFGQIAPSHSAEAYTFWRKHCGVAANVMSGIIPGFMEDAVKKGSTDLITCQFTSFSLQKIYENTEKSQKSVIFTMDVPIETKFLFRDQMNTANVFLRSSADPEVVGYRLFDSAILYNGFRYTVVCPELDEARISCKKCGYCGSWQKDENEEYHLGCADKISFNHLHLTQYRNVYYVSGLLNGRNTDVPDYVLKNFEEKNYGK